MKGRKTGGKVRVFDDPVNVNVRLEQKDLQRIRMFATVRGVSPASIIRSAIDKYLDRLERHPWYRSQKP